MPGKQTADSAMTKSEKALPELEAHTRSKHFLIWKPHWAWATTELPSGRS